MNKQLMSKFLRSRRMAGCVAVVVTAALSLVLAGTALAAPANTVAPVISGLLRAGQTLAVSTGTWTPGVTSFSYAWTRGGAAVGSDSPNYAVTTADIGQEIAVTVSATDGTGTTPATPVSAGVVPAPPANTGAPTISGIAQQGQLLTAGTGTWSGTAPITYTYQWSSGGTPVGTNLSTYVVAPADIGKLITVAITASNAGGGPVGPVGSAAAGPVLPLLPANATPPTITGTAQQGQVLTVTPGTWTPVQSLITEQWEDCTTLVCTPIPGEIGTTYTVGAGDVGHTIRVLETDSNAAALLGVGKASAQTATVSATSATSVVAFSQNAPSTNQTVTLVATVSSNSGNANPHGSLTFLNGSNAVPGCANKGVSGGLTVTIVCQSSFGAGQAQISATYVPDPTALVAGSTSDTTSVDIGKGSTSMSLAVTPKVAPGGRATYVATLGVPPADAGSILPSGTIDFLDGGQPIAGCVNQALSSLTATCSVSYPSAGLHSITARYDGDSNFTGSTSPSSGVQVVKGAPKAPSVRGALGSTLGWRLFYHPRYSEMTELKVFAIAKGTTILVQCSGKGCPFASRDIKHASGQLDLLPAFRHRHLGPGARITVRFMRTHWIGKYYSITIRPGRKPKTVQTCLPPGGGTPGVGCRSK